MARRKQERSGGTPATVLLDREGIRYLPRSYEHDPATPSFGLEAARALDVEPGRVFKTLLVQTEAGLGVGIVPVDSQLDLKAVAVVLGAKKAVMAAPTVAERSTGYVVGGISPIGQKQRLPTVLDASAQQFETILVSGGRRGFDLELTPADLVAVTGAVLAPIAR